MIEYNSETGLRHLPAPTFVHGNEDGSIQMEWCYGKQGAQDSWRVYLDWGPEGIYGVRIISRKDAVGLTRVHDQETTDWAVFTDWLAQEPVGASPAELEYEQQRKPCACKQG